MTTNPTTPDQGDERRAFEERYKHLNLSKTTDAWDRPVYCSAIVGALWEGWQEGRASLLAAAQPVAQPVVDQKPASMSDNGSCGSQVRGKPVSAEAGKGATVVVPWEPTTAMVNAGQCGCMDNDVTVSIYKAMLAAAPSESVAVSGEVSDVAIDSAISTVWEDWEDDIDRRRELARAVLVLAGSAKQAAALERMARLDDEMGIEP